MFLCALKNRAFRLREWLCLSSSLVIVHSPCLSEMAIAHLQFVRIITFVFLSVGTFVVWLIRMLKEIHVLLDHILSFDFT